ncbi:MAG: DUF4332 domain-containing protein [Pseudanabaenales cyanobacterium]|nr:DUF4332 domain-containing protein [Pseudanabaenales cyanobacterium]
MKSSNWKIQQLPGLNAQNQTQLAAVGVYTTQQLLNQGSTAAKRQILSTRLQVHIQHVNKWIALADLSCVPSVGCQYCGLLLHAGVSSTVQLAQMPLYRLHSQIRRLQVTTLRRADLCPDVGQVAEWIRQAKSLV